MKRKNTLAVMIFLFLFTMCGCKAQNDDFPPVTEVTGDFTVDVLKIGQADSLLLQTAEHAVLLDCGEKGDGEEILSFLQEQGIRQLDYMIITHFDKDHVGGAAKILEKTAVRQILTPNYKGTNDGYINMIQIAKDKEIPVEAMENTISFILDDACFEVFPPQKSEYAEGDNDYSLAMRVTHGSNRFLFTGDAEAERILEITDTLAGDYDFLKVPHHGRYNQNTKKLISSTKPNVSVVCDSAKNPAEEETLRCLQSAKSGVYCTKDGDIRIISNGKELQVVQ